MTGDWRTMCDACLFNALFSIFSLFSHSITPIVSVFHPHLSWHCSKHTLTCSVDVNKNWTKNSSLIGRWSMEIPSPAACSVRERATWWEASVWVRCQIPKFIILCHLLSLYLHISIVDNKMIFTHARALLYYNHYVIIHRFFWLTVTAPIVSNSKLLMHL